MVLKPRVALLVLGLAFATLIAAGAGGGADPESRARRWIDAFNQGEPAYAAYCSRELAPGRTSQEERLSLYRRMRSDLGRLELEALDARTDGTVKATARSEHRGPVVIEFHFEPSGDGRITGVGIELGGPQGGHGEEGPQLPPIDVPAEGLDRARLEALVDGWLRQLAATDVFSGVVLLARDAAPVFERAYGLAERRFAAPVRTTTRFNVGSITKAFTMVAVAQLAAAGSLELDSPIARYLPDYPDSEVARRISIRQLVDHASGLGDIFGDVFLEASNHRFREPRDFFQLFAGQPLLFSPGEGRAYSNAGFVVLGAIVEAVSGQPYASSIQTRVFDPAGMTGSGFFASDGLEPDVAVGYTAEGCPEDQRGPCRSNLITKVWAGCPAGGSHSPAIDLLRFDEALRSHRLTAPEWTRWVMARVDPVEGGPADAGRASWGWAIAGGAPGVNAELESDGHNTVIVMSNLDPPVAIRIAGALKPVLASYQP